MTFVAGICRFDGGGVSEAELSAMIDALSLLGRDGVATRRSEKAFFARGLCSSALEDRFDRQPILSERSRQLIVADARLDNRRELLDLLDLPESAPLSDADLLARTFDRYGERAFEQVCGDFALAAWDEPRRQLTLARDITGQRPLNFHVSPTLVAFATMPHALLALEYVDPRLSQLQIAEFVADIPRTGDRTYFENIRRVEPGRVVRINPSGISIRHHWSTPIRTTLVKTDKDYVEEWRHHLDRAVDSRIRDCGSEVGAHLSGGLDSGAVASTAALRVGDGGRVLAFTSAPRLNFSAIAPRGRILDESALASKVCASHNNMDHIIVRAEAHSALSVIRRDSALFGEPLGLPCNQVWWAEINATAAREGLSVLLTGESGNYALTSGSANALAEFVSDGAIGDLLHEARALLANDFRLRGIAAAAFGPWVPRPLWSLIQRLNWGRSTTSQGEGLLSLSARALLPKNLAEASRSGRPTADHRQNLSMLLQAGDPGLFRKGTLAHWGIDERDPTTDRKLVEFCLSVPSKQLLKNGFTRSLARRALTDRLPQEVLFGPRGYQGADWFERIDRVELVQILTELGSDQACVEILDFEAMKRLADLWPADGWERGTIISTFRYALLRAIAAGAFVAAFSSTPPPTAMASRSSINGSITEPH